MNTSFEVFVFRNGRFFLTKKLIQMIWSNSQRLDLKPVDTAVLVQIASCSDHRITPVAKRVSELSQSIGYSPRTVGRSLNALVSKKLITRVDPLPSKNPNRITDKRIRSYKINVRGFRTQERT